MEKSEDYNSRTKLLYGQYGVKMAAAAAAAAVAEEEKVRWEG